MKPFRPIAALALALALTMALSILAGPAAAQNVQAPAAQPLPRTFEPLVPPGTDDTAADRPRVLGCVYALSWWYPDEGSDMGPSLRFTVGSAEGVVNGWARFFDGQIYFNHVDPAAGTNRLTRVVYAGTPGSYDPERDFDWLMTPLLDAARYKVHLEVIMSPAAPTAAAPSGAGAYLVVHYDMPCRP